MKVVLHLLRSNCFLQFFFAIFTYHPLKAAQHQENKNNYKKIVTIEQQENNNKKTRIRKQEQENNKKKPNIRKQQQGNNNKKTTN